jgi:hypothetical protein
MQLLAAWQPGTAATMLWQPISESTAYLLEESCQPCPALHAQVVTCSGFESAGSLRIVRNGIGVIEQATVELEGKPSCRYLSDLHSMQPQSWLISHEHSVRVRRN